jgi:hypothetical protein
VRAASWLSWRQRGTTTGTVTENTAVRTLVSERTDGSTAPWPRVSLAPGEDELDRQEAIEIKVSCPTFLSQPFDWRGFDPPSDWKPGAACEVMETVKGLKVRPAAH